MTSFCCLAAKNLMTTFVAFAIGAWGMVGLALNLEESRLDEPKAPPVVTPGPFVEAPPPEGAVVLFEGKDASQWVDRRGKPTKWEVVDGELRCKPGTGDAITKEKFGDAEIHLEFATPHMPDAKGQQRGNSGVYIQGRYELQILDSYNAETYPNGQCGAIYLQHVPLKNACRPPKEWQSYDIVFKAARKEGDKEIPARVTVKHNGVLIQDDVEMKTVTPGEMDKKVLEPGPLRLQDHGNDVKFRNIWVKKLGS
jgi:hypothetical protein